MPYLVDFWRWCALHPFAPFPDVEALPGFVALLYFLFAHVYGFSWTYRGLLGRERHNVELAEYFRKIYILLCVLAVAFLGAEAALLSTSIADAMGYVGTAVIFAMCAWMVRKPPHWLYHD